MNKYRSCVGLVILIIVLILIAAIGYLILRGTSNVNKQGNIPPTIIISSPAPNETIMSGSFLLANVTATGQNPITRLELWFDGTIFETQMPDANPGDATTFYATTSILMTEGPHMFSARAVDSKGLVGQSLPVTVQGLPRPQQESDTNGTSAQVLDPNKPPPATGPSTGSPSQPPASIIPPAPLPVTPSGTPMLPILEIKPIDLSSLLPIIISGRPKAPTSLQAGYENCKIRLVWMDNADNEKHFNVWMQALGGPPMVIATLKGTPKTGPAWYEFVSPVTGIYSFWIEAANMLGTQSSEIAWVGVTDLNCSPGVATQLNIEIVDMYVPGGYDQTYCYLSIEGTPEKRTPPSDGTYISVINGFVDVSNWTGNGNKILVPLPTDNEITMEGKCLGRKGGAKPETLGTFATSAPKEDWDGRRLELKPSNSTYTIGYRIQYHGSTQVIAGDYKYTDYTIPAPTDLSITTQTASNPSSNAILARIPNLQWAWSGDPVKLNLTGFTVIMEGKPIQTSNQVKIGTGKWEDTFFLPTACGGIYKLQVAANSGNAQSVPSTVYEYKQPPCDLYAEVKLESFEFTYVDDGDPPCDTAQVYFTVFVSGETRSFGGPNLYYELGCGIHYFADFTPTSAYQGSVDTFYVALEPPSPSNPANPKIDISLFYNDADFWSDDYLCHTNTRFQARYSDWANYRDTRTFPCPGPNWTSSSGWDANGTITISVRGFEAADASRSSNPGIGPPVGP